MKNAEEAIVEAGSEELGKPIVKGLLTGVIGTVIELAKEHQYIIVGFVLVGGVLVVVIIKYKIKKKKTMKQVYQVGKINTKF
jgi:hypothetical protein